MKSINQGALGVVHSANHDTQQPAEIHSHITTACFDLLARYYLPGLPWGWHRLSLFGVRW